VAHANARLTVYGRRLLVERVLAGHRPVDVAHQLGVSRATAYKWVARYRTQGLAGLSDRPSRPHRTPHRLDAATEARILVARTTHRRGPRWIAAELGLVASTVGRVLVRCGAGRLSDCDALTGERVRRGPSSGVRYERKRPGELIHVDVKKLGRIPDGGGWRAHGRGARPSARRGQGYDCVHAAVDDHSRLAYCEVLPNQKGTTCAEFLGRAAAFFARHGITHIERVMTDNAWNYRKSTAWTTAVAALKARQLFIRPHCPWTNGKVERFNRTLCAEWAYAQVFLSNAQRTGCLPDWLEYYNTRRRHSALKDQPPISRLSTTS